MSHNAREKENGVRGRGFGKFKMVSCQKQVLGMKTGRAVCHSQASDSTLPEKAHNPPPK